MAGVTIQMRADKQHSLRSIHEKIHIIEGAEQVSKTVQTIHDVTIWVLVYEKYFFRVNNYATATIVLTECGQEQTACISVAGGGSGIANVSYGANRNFAKDFLSALESCGFQVIASDLDKYGKHSLKYFRE